MDEKKDMLLTAELKEEEKIEADSPTDDKNDSEISSPAQTGSILKKIFVSAMCLITLTTALFCGIYIFGKLDISAESITKLAVKTITGRDAVAVASSEVKESAAETEAKDENVSPYSTAAKTDEETDAREEYVITPIPIELSNETPYEPDTDALLAAGRIIPKAEELYAVYGEGEPLVLILHTHGSEGFSDTSDSGYRTTDSGKNVVTLGDRVTQKLNDSGIKTIHSPVLYDNPDFNMSYYNASLAIKKYLDEYPSISYIIDIHRDSIMGEDGEYYAPTATIENKVKAAQIMFVVGTDYGGSGHTGWRDNLTLALRLQCGISADYPTIMRNINLRSASFNEQYTKGSMLVEIGSCASTLDEALLSADIFAEALAREILG